MNTKTPKKAASTTPHSALFDMVERLVTAHDNQEQRYEKLLTWLNEGIAQETFSPAQHSDQDFLNLVREREQARRLAREQTHERLNHLLTGLFVWNVPTSEVSLILARELAGLEWADQRVASGNGETLEEALRFEIRVALTREDKGGTMLVQHLKDQIGFFELQPMEIGSWAKFFLDVELYHREKRVAEQERSDLLSQIRRRLKLGGILRSPQEFILYLDAALEEAGSNPDLEILAVELSEQLQGRLAPNLLPHVDLAAVVTLCLTCHRFCRQDTVADHHARRLAELKARREFYCLEDLMLLIYDQALMERQLPATATLLDTLQEQGFPIEHRDFRDVYRAQLLPLELSRMVTHKKLCLFTPLESLSGDLLHDLGDSQALLLERLQSTQRQLHHETGSFYQGLSQPLPRATLLKAACNFAITWELAARLERGKTAAVRQTDTEDLAAAGLALLPKAMLKLIRPRKGYEFKSRDDFRFHANRMAQVMLEPLQEMLASGRATSPYHSSVLLRLALLAPLTGQKQLAELTRDQCLGALEETDPESALEAMASRLNVDLAGAAPVSMAQLNRLLAEALSEVEICSRALQRLSLKPDDDPSREAGSTLAALMADLIPLLYRLAVAQARSKATLSRLPAEAASIGPLTQLLAPALPHLEATALEQAKTRIKTQGTQGLMSRYRPLLETREELKAAAKYHLAGILNGDSLEAYGSQHDLGQLESSLTQALSRYHIAPGILEAEDLSAFLLQTVQPEDPTDGQKRALAVRELHQLLPRTNCATCGQPSCQHFAHTLLKAQAQPSDCHQMDPDNLAQLETRLKDLLASGIPPAPEELTDQERYLLEPLTKVENVLTRFKILETHEKNFQERSSHLTLFKRPDPDTFHLHLVRHLGFEIAERLTASDRRFLEHHGEARVRAGWLALGGSSDWLQLELRQHQSSGFQQQHDPLEMSREFYADKLFMSQLSQEDRRRISWYRLTTHMEDFAQWWNGDLVEMSDPDYQIQDWDDFAKIIKNAYWHQEHTPAAGDILTDLKAHIEKDLGFKKMAHRFLNHYIHGLAGQEFQQAKKRRQLRERILAAGRIETQQELDLMLSHFVATLPRALRHEPRAKGPQVVASGFEGFNLASLEISPDLRFFWEELDEEIHDTLSGDPRLDTAELADFQNNPEGMSWSQMDTVRGGLIRALLSSVWQQARLEYMEVRLVTDIFTGKAELATTTSKTGDSANERQPLKLLPGMLRCYLRQRCKSADVDLNTIRSELDRRLQRQPQLASDLLDEALSQHIRHRLSLAMEHGASVPHLEREPKIGELTAWVDAEIYRQTEMDRERLLHYLFLLAKMEGNLDSLTALLRGIRETSDIIEAAWLQFTQDRAALAPLPEMDPGVIPLRATVLKDKEQLNEYLRQGLPRGEKKEVAHAIQELITHIRFLILHSDRENIEPAGILADMQTHGYCLEGIDQKALLEAIRNQISQQPSYQKDKIWIYTTVTAHNLSATNHALLEAERAFHKRRSQILKSEKGADAYKLGEICARRGVELAKVKEEMYYQLSELLEEERIGSFQKRIGQILAQLDKKRAEIGRGWRYGLINRRTVFYLLRRYQKETTAPSWTDYLAFIRDHWRLPLETLAKSGRPEETQLRKRLTSRVGAVLGLDLAALEESAREAAQQELEMALTERLEAMERLFAEKEWTRRYGDTMTR